MNRVRGLKVIEREQDRKIDQISNWRLLDLISSAIFSYLMGLWSCIKKAFKKYVFDNRWGSVSELATKLGKSVSYISKWLMLLDLPSEVTKAIYENLLGPSIAEELFSIR